MPYLRFFFTRGFLIASVALFAVYFVDPGAQVAGVRRGR